MFSFISTAHAQSATPAAPAGSGGLFGGMDGLSGMLLPLVMIGAMWFLMIRPQQKRAKEAKAMVDALKGGDEVITAGGLLGKITKATEQYVVLELGAGHEVTLQRGAVTQVLPKGTLKSI